ncbi:lipid A biosynthesis lauroyl acyltransferase [Candidatus Chlamydia sanziniae]|uniref:Lipid A biosynthesis lauroyl acyltransferase n=1 Tax=Candidatus Chlamydia sanziniae TaxID=1806891 RepID=A0A1A9HXR3_9CHLA|nr:lipid A biosynthesis lauroyl acyltransferase [Candidatus Chlamydia sanziniae]ANH78883.1 Lipid A biosynthesis lauroyl acyltransferase [Candidatus Chlamydia sanziniae]
MPQKLRQIQQNLLEAPLYYVVIGTIAVCKRIPMMILRRVGKILGTLAFYTIADYRKTSLTNLALAFPHKPFHERYILAKESLQHFMITILELLGIEKLIQNIDSLISITTSSQQPEGFTSQEVLSDDGLKQTFQELEENKGVILFSGHQANWELPFLFITKNYSGLAFAKPIKNRKLSKKIFALREVFKGKIVEPKHGIHHAIEALRKGQFVGIVGDQALLMSPYAYSLFGSPAFTTTSPALLAYKTGRPVIAITVYRREQDYQVIPSPKFYADKNLPMKEAIKKLMDELMTFLEKGIACKPEQWLWIHKRWKRKLSPIVKKKYRYSHILVIVVQASLPQYMSFLEALAVCFSGATLTLALQSSTHLQESQQNLSAYTSFTFRNFEDLLTLPNQFPAVFDLTDNSKQLHKHYKKTGSVAVYSKRSLEKKLPNSQASLEAALQSFYDKKQRNPLLINKR